MPRYFIGQRSLIGLIPKPLRIVLVPDARDIEVSNRHCEYRFELQLRQLLADAISWSQLERPLFRIRISEVRGLDKGQRICV